MGLIGHGAWASRYLILREIRVWPTLRRWGGALVSGDRWNVAIAIRRVELPAGPEHADGGSRTLGYSMEKRRPLKTRTFNGPFRPREAPPLWRFSVAPGSR